MDFEAIRQIREVSEKPTRYVNDDLRQGWVLLEIKKERQVQEDGSFRDEVTFILGHQDPDAK
jgi:hypothetical protein